MGPFFDDRCLFYYFHRAVYTSFSRLFCDFLRVSVQTGCSKASKAGAKHHLHRKTYILPCELATCSACFDLSVGYTMFFSRRWMLCCRKRTMQTTCLNCYHSKNRVQTSVKINKAILLHCGQFSGQGAAVHAQILCHFHFVQRYLNLLVIRSPLFLVCQPQYLLKIGHDLSPDRVP